MKPFGWAWRRSADLDWQFKSGAEKPELGFTTTYAANVEWRPVYDASPLVVTPEVIAAVGKAIRDAELTHTASSQWIDHVARLAIDAYVSASISAIFAAPQESK